MVCTSSCCCQFGVVLGDFVAVTWWLLQNCYFVLISRPNFFPSPSQIITNSLNVISRREESVPSNITVVTVAVTSHLELKQIMKVVGQVQLLYIGFPMLAFSYCYNGYICVLLRLRFCLFLSGVYPLFRSIRFCFCMFVEISYY